MCLCIEKCHSFSFNFLLVIIFFLFNTRITACNVCAIRSKISKFCLYQIWWIRNNTGKGDAYVIRRIIKRHHLNANIWVLWIKKRREININWKATYCVWCVPFLNEIRDVCYLFVKQNFYSFFFLFVRTYIRWIVKSLTWYFNSWLLFWLSHVERHDMTIEYSVEKWDKRLKFLCMSYPQMHTSMRN